MATLNPSVVPQGSAAPAAPAFRLSWWQHGAIFLLACLVIFSRRPGMLLHAQFYAEDGARWFADAYNQGWLRALLLPWHGIFQTLPRLAAGPALLVPLTAAPALLNLIHIGLWALPVNLLLNARSAAWGEFRFRAAMAVLFLALPDCTEISYGISWSMWTTAVAALLLIVATLPEGWGERTTEALLLLLVGFSGPMGILLLPISIFLALKRPHSWRWVQCTLLLAGSVVQGYTILFLDRSGRPYYGLHITPASLTNILGRNIFLGTLLGHASPLSLNGIGGEVCLLLIALGGLALLVWCFLHAQLEMRLFLLFAAMLLSASLARPTEYPPLGMTIWEYLAHSPDIRYWFIPSLAFAWAILWCWQNGNPVLKVACTLLLGIMAFGVVRNWEHRPLPDLHYAEYVTRFQAAPSGTAVHIPENPVDSGWEIELVKH